MYLFIPTTGRLRLLVSVTPLKGSIRMLVVLVRGTPACGNIFWISSTAEKHPPSGLRYSMAGLAWQPRIATAASRAFMAEMLYAQGTTASTLVVLERIAYRNYCYRISVSTLVLQLWRFCFIMFGIALMITHVPMNCGKFCPLSDKNRIAIKVCLIIFEQRGHHSDDNACSNELWQIYPLSDKNGESTEH